MIEPKDSLSPDQSFFPPPPPWRQNTYNRPAMPTPPMPPMGGNFSGGSLPGVGDLLSQSWRIFISNAGTYIGIAILPIIVQIIAVVIIFFKFPLLSLFSSGHASWIASVPVAIFLPSFLYGDFFSDFNLVVFIVIGLVIGAIQVLSQAALIYASVQRDRKVGLGEAYGFALGKIFSFLWIAILSIIIIAGGSFLFVIPGILFAIWFIFAFFILMAEDARGMTAILKSREYVKGKWLSVFWRFLAFALIVGLVFLAFYIGLSIAGVTILAAIESSIVKTIAGLVIFFGSLLVQPIIAALSVIYSALIYEHLRVARGVAAYIPSLAQKAIFLGIGILGWTFPIIGSFGIIGSLFSQKTNTQTGINIGNIITIAAQAKQRDTRRLTDVKGIQNALELYFVDYNGYPAVASPVIIGAGNAARLDASGWSAANDTDAPVYMIKAPANPISGGADYIYYSMDASGNPCTQGPSCAAYTITFKLESGAGGYKSGKFVASPPDVIMEMPKEINGLENSKYNTNANLNGNINGSNQDADSLLFQDEDNDGLSNGTEKILGTNPNIADTDFDGLSDGDEVNVWKTKPTNPDTDGDGFRDGDEAKNGYNPLGGGKTTQ